MAFSPTPVNLIVIFLLFYGTVIALIFGWIPRVIARRLAAELAENPGAAERHRRDRRWQIFGAIMGFLTGGGAVLWVILQ